MLTRKQYENFVWIDLEAPTREEIEKVVKEFSIPDEVKHELSSPSIRPKAEKHGAYLYLVLHFPALGLSQTVREQEIDFVMGEHAIITTRYEQLEILRSLSRVSDAEEEPYFVRTVDFFVSSIKKIYKAVIQETDDIKDVLEKIEKRIYEHSADDESVLALSRAGRDILNLKQTMGPHQEILESLYEILPSMTGAGTRNEIKTIENIWYKVEKRIRRLSETLSELRETNNALINTRENKIILVLTLFSAVSIPMMFAINLFGMNVGGTPFGNSTFGFWAVLFLSVILGLATFAVFRIKKLW